MAHFYVSYFPSLLRQVAYLFCKWSNRLWELPTHGGCTAGYQQSQAVLEIFFLPASFFFFNKEVWSSPDICRTRMSQRHPWWMICTKMRAEKGGEDQCWLIRVHLWCSQLMYLSHPTPPHQVESVDITQHLMHDRQVFCHWAISLALAFLRQVLAM